MSLNPIVPHSTSFLSHSHFYVTCSKVPIWLFWNSTFFIFEILTLIQIFASLGPFSTVHHIFLQIFYKVQNKCFLPAKSKSVRIFRYIFPSYRRIHLRFINSARLTSRVFRLRTFFYIKLVEFEPDKLAFFCFFH
jgi:hypothetical protein